MENPVLFENLILAGILFVLDFLLMFIAGIVLLIIIRRVKNTELRLLFAALSAFAITHPMYHLAGFLGQSALAFRILQPLSVLFLLAFGFMLLRRT